MDVTRGDTRRPRSGRVASYALLKLAAWRFLKLSLKPGWTLAGLVTIAPGAFVGALAAVFGTTVLGVVVGALLIAATSFFVAGARLQGLLHDTPCLRFVGVDRAEATVYQAVQLSAGIAAAQSASAAPMMVATGSTNLFLRVQVANDPGQDGECPTARQAVASIVFRDHNTGEKLLSFYGRWAETSQRAETGKMGLSLDETRIDLEPNGQPYTLDVAMKIPGALDFYAYNHENSTAPDARLPAHRIDVRKTSWVDVEITIRPTNRGAITGRFWLVDEGANGIRLQKVEEEALPLRAARLRRQLASVTRLPLRLRRARETPPAKLKA